MRTLRAVAILLSLSLSASALAELRTYDVASQYRQEVYQALRDVLQIDDPKARIERLPTGQLLIDTSPGTHAEIESILDAIAAHETPATPRVTLRYWAVLGSPNAADVSNVPAVLRDVLDEVEALHGDLGFRVLGNATLVTESGQRGGLDGDPLTIRQQAYAQGTALNAEIQIRFTYPQNVVRPNGGNVFQTRQLKEQSVNLTATLESGEFVVLGENTLGPNAINGEELEGTLFYIVNWSAEN